VGGDGGKGKVCGRVIRGVVGGGGCVVVRNIDGDIPREVGNGNVVVVVVVSVSVADTDVDVGVRRTQTSEGGSAGVE